MRTIPKRLSRAALTASALALTAAHAQLLWERVVDGSLLEPAIGGRWLLAAALLGLVGLARGRGLSLRRGRPALAFWLAVFVLHAVAVVPAAGGATLELEPEPLLLLPAGALLLALAAATDLGARPAPCRRRPVVPAVRSTAAAHGGGGQWLRRAIPARAPPAR